MRTRRKLSAVDPKRKALSSQARLVVEAIEHEMEPCAPVTHFLAPCVHALVRGQILVGPIRPEIGGERTRPVLVAAFPDGRLTVGGVEVRCDLAGVELSPGLVRHRGHTWSVPIQLPARDAFDLAVCWYSLVGWQIADMIAREGEGCPDCRGACVVPVESAAAGRLFVSCACVEVEVPDESAGRARPEEDDAREEPGAWFQVARAGIEAA